MDVDFYERFKKIVEQIESIGIEYAEAKGQSWQAQNLEYAVLSEEMKKLTGSVEQKKIDARASDGFRAWVEQTAGMIKKENILKVKWEAAKAKFEAYRSLSSLEKSTRAAS